MTGPVLIAGDATDLRMIRRVLDSLPPESTGAVFIEVFSAVQVAEVVAPAGLGVTWLLRQEATSDEHGGRGARKGETLVRAVGAWLDEWVLADDEGDYLLWVGCRANPRVDRFCDELEHLLHEREHRIYERRLHER